MAVNDQEGRSFLPRTRKTRALLAVLAMAGSKPVLRPHLASLLWSQREREQARASLRQSVHELQDTLGYTWGDLLVADRHNLTLHDTRLEIDAMALVQPGGDTAATLDRFKDELLEDLNGLDPAFDRWLAEERARLTRMGRAIGENLLARCQDPAAAMEAAERLLAVDRTHQGAWRTLMRAYADGGDHDSALATYDRCRTTLADAAQGRPSAETEDLATRIRADTTHSAKPEGTPQPPLLPAPRRDRTTLRLCVAPLRALGNEPDDGLAAGLAEEISAGLSRFRWISCVPATLWRGTPDGNPAAATWAGQEGDMVLDGTVQRAAGRVRINARLIDMRAAGEIIWAARFDRDLTDPLALQDEVAAAIVAQVDPELMRHEGRRVAGRSTSGLSGQDLLLQALPALYRMEKQAFIAARQILEASLLADEGSSVAHGWLAYWNLLYVGQGWATDPAKSTAEAAALAERAVALDPSDARALTLAGHVRSFLGKRPQEAAALHDRALTLNPNLAIAWCFSGLSCCYIGEHDEGLRRIGQAQRLSPSDPHSFFFDMALIMPHLLRGDYRNAIAVGRRAVELNPSFTSGYKGYLSALGHVGGTQEVKHVLHRLLELEPGFSVQNAVQRSPLVRPQDLALYAEGLRRAGLAETSMLPPIDLMSADPQSPPTLRVDPPTTGGF